MLGRWTAKQAAAAYLDLSGGSHPPPERIELLSGPGGVPEFVIDGEAPGFGVSLSHSKGVALCVLAARGVAIGCDLEVVSPRASAFERDFFTSEEQALFGNPGGPRHDLTVTLCWSAKESALKALGVGLRADTRSVVVNHLAMGEAGGWSEITVEQAVTGRTFGGWWRREEDPLVATLVSDPTPLPPTAL